ncbi:unnamed protein product [Ectocarpus sp. 4 AP-2014]
MNDSHALSSLTSGPYCCFLFVCAEFRDGGVQCAFSSRKYLKVFRSTCFAHLTLYSLRTGLPYYYCPSDRHPRLCTIFPANHPCFSEWATNQHRDSIASHIGHSDLLMYFAVAENNAVGRVRYQLLEKMLQPCGPPPAKDDDDI